MPKVKRRIAFRLRFWVLCVAVLFAIFVPIYNTQNRLAEEKKQQLEALQQQQYQEAMRGDELRRQLEYSDTDAFRAREARRSYGYVLPGSIRYVVEESFGVHDVQAVPALAVQGEAVQLDGANTAATQGTVPNATQEPALDKDWGNFGGNEGN